MKASVNLFGLTPDRVVTRIRLLSAEPRVPTLLYSLWFGGLGFCLASLVVFATVAFGERSMYRYFGLSGAYAVWTLLFILGGGGVLSALVIGPSRLIRFYLLFSVAFFFYAASWIVAYFTLRSATGEWVGSFVGSVLMGLILAVAFGARQSLLKLILGLFLANSAGYFLGDLLNNAIGGKLGMLLWGAVYGLGLGAGLGYALYLAQAPVRDRLRSIADFGMRSAD